MKSFRLLLPLLLSPALVEAQSLSNAILRNSFSPAGAGARAAGMGGAFLAIADDGTAASFNPAGLAQLRKPEFAFVAYEDQFRSKLSTSPADLPADSVSERQSEPQFVGFALPTDLGLRRLTLQLSYERTVDLQGRGNASAALLGTDGQDLRTFVATLDGTQEGALHTVTAAAGFDFGTGLMLGASVSAWIGEWDGKGTESTSVVLPDGERVLIEQEQYTQQHSLRGFNANLGVLYRRPWCSVGAVVRLPFQARYRFDERVDSQDFYPERTAERTEYTPRTVLHWPLSAGLGVALRPHRGLTVAGEASWTEWETTIVDNVPDGALLTMTEETPFVDRNFFDLFPASQSLTASAAQWRVGVEYLVNLPWFVVPLRVGHSWEASPVPDLSLSSGRRIRAATVGWGINWNRVALDFAWQRRTSSGAVGAILGPRELMDIRFPTEDVTQDLALTSFTFRF